MSQSTFSKLRPCALHLLSGLALLLAISAAPVRADSLHAVWHGEGSSALVDQMLTTLAEDLRSNRLLLTTGTEQLRSFLLQRLCLDSGAGCMAHAPTVSAASLGLTPTDLELLLQHLNASLQTRQLPLPQQQRLLQQFTGQSPAESTQRPLASL
jgi:hypothetical protein